MKDITKELLSRGFIQNNINTKNKESIFEYMFNNAVNHANWKSFKNWQKWKEIEYKENLEEKMSTMQKFIDDFDKDNS